LVGIEPVVDGDGRPDTHLLLAPPLVPTVPRPHRPFQGWRYLAAAVFCSVRNVIRPL